MSFNCLIIDPMHSSIVPLLGDIGIIGNYQPEITRTEVLKILPDYDGLILRSKLTVDTEILDASKNLKFIARAGAGMDQIDVEQTKIRGIQLINASEGNADAVGEHTLGMLLNLLNKIRIGDLEVRNKIWLREENRGYEIKGKTVGIIGYGFMGKSFAKKLNSFECNIVAFDKFKTDISDGIVKEVTLNEIFETCDIVSLHFPLNKENKNCINFDFLNSFKKPFWLLNTARGEVLDTAALITLLKSGKILGAALDVLENEKLGSLNERQIEEFNFLSLSNKVILTPHVAGWTYESYYKINKVLVEKIKNSNIVYNF